MLRKGDKKNFETLQRAFKNGDVCLMECTDAKTGDYRAVICAAYREGDEIVTVPFAQLFDGNPYEMVNPPA